MTVVLLVIGGISMMSTQSALTGTVALMVVWGYLVSQVIWKIPSMNLH